MDDYDSFSSPVTSDSGAPVTPGEYDSFSSIPTAVSTQEGASAVAEGAGYGFTRGLGALGGAALGAKGGAMAGAVAGPVGAAVGGVIGGVGGAYLGSEGPGKMATDAMGLRGPEEMDQRLRPYAFAGESLGGAATVMGSVYSLARTGIQFAEQGIGRFMNQVMDTARNRTGVFVAAEVGSATTAAAGAGFAEALAPGQTEFRIGAELVGGAFGPRIAEAVVKRGYTEVRRLAEGFTASGAENGAARMIADVYRRTGGDIAVTARLYRQQGIIPTGDLTPAQKTGSPELAAIEEYAASINKEFGLKVDSRFRDALDVLRGNIAQLSMAGDPASLEVAAKMRKDFFEGLVQGRAQSAAAMAQAQAAKISPDDRRGIAEASARMNEIVQEGILLSRKQENVVWADWLRIDGQRPATATNLSDTFAKHEEKLDTWAGELPSEVRQFLKNLQGPSNPKLSLDPRTNLMTLREVPGSAQPTTAEKMWNQRSQILAEMRKAKSGAQPDHNRARILGDLADAISRDLESAMSPEGRVAFDNAREYTKEFYEVYQRSFVGQTQATGAYGDTLPPELIGSRAFAGPDEQVLMRLDDLEEATQFIKRQGLGGDTAVGDMLDAQERIARIVSTSVIDVSTGRVDPKKIDVLLKDPLRGKPALFERFPELKADLLAAQKSEDAARNIERIGQGQTKTIESRIFSRILKKEPVPVAMEILASPNMEKDLQKFLGAVKPIKSRSGGWVVSPEDADRAKKGAAASVFEGALRLSLDKNGVLNLNAFRLLVERPAVPGQKAAIEILLENGVVDQKQVSSIRRLFNEMESITSTTRFQTSAQVTPDVADVGGAVIARMLGSGVAGNVARAAGSSSPSLIVHGAGARFFEHVYSKLGITTAARFLSEAMLDPVKADLLLQKASKMTPVQRAQTNRRIHAWLVQSGLGLGEEMGAATEAEMRPYMQPNTEAPQMFSAPR